MWLRRWREEVWGRQESLSTNAQKRLNEAATSLGLRAEAVGTDTDAERLGLPKVVNSFAIYDSDYHDEPS
jgi:hypothetical protein